MRFRLSLAFVLLLAFSTVTNCANAEILVYLVGGQSNADGRANAAGLSGGLENPQPDVDFFFHTEGLLGAPNSNHPLDSVLTTLRPGQSETSGFGPAISFGRSMADFYSGANDPSVAIVKYANGGTNIHTQWAAGGTNGTAGDGSEYVIFQNTVNDGIAAIQAANPGETVTIAGMIWVQGESDADTTANANAYEANLVNFINDIRLTYGADLDFAIAQLSTSQTALNSQLLATIRSGQANVAANDPNTLAIDSDAFYEGQGDGLHYNANGQVALGNALAVALQGSAEPESGDGITVVNSASIAFGDIATVQQAQSTLPDFDAGTNTKLVVGFAVENGDSDLFGVTFGGVALTEVISSSDSSGIESTNIFILDGASGVGDIVVTTGSDATLTGNGPGIFAVALSGAAPGFETSDAFGDDVPVQGDLTGTLTGIISGAYVLAVFADQGNGNAQNVTGLTRVSVFNGNSEARIGSAVGLVASDFGDGSDITVTFNDLGQNLGGVDPANRAFQDRGNFVFASFAAAPDSEPLLGDVNLDGSVDFRDIVPFIRLLSMPDSFQFEADINQDDLVNFQDIVPFIAILSAG